MIWLIIIYVLSIHQSYYWYYKHHKKEFFPRIRFTRGDLIFVTIYAIFPIINTMFSILFMCMVLDINKWLDKPVKSLN